MTKNKISKKANSGIGIDNFGHSIWQLSHVHYTGRFLPKKKTAYPALLLIVLLVGVFLTGWSKIVIASASASYNVVTTVVAAPINQSATILYPHNNSTVYNSTINVNGSCQSPSYVVLTKNNLFGGVALCSSSNTWSISVSLLSGSNILQAKIFNLTNRPGPLSSQIKTDYVSSGNISLDNPLILKSNFDYQGVNVGQQFNLPLDLEGGKPPYAISINWGDSTTSLISQASDGTISIPHIYKKTENYKGSYKIIVSTTDTQGKQTSLQLLAIVNLNSSSENSIANISNNSAGNGIFSNIEKYIWPSYAIVILMLISFWLGERQEFYKNKSSK